MTRAEFVGVGGAAHKIVQMVVRLYREARRRKVFRTAALYIVSAWLALQVANTLFPGFGIPDAAIRGLVWAAVLGFPVAVVFGWLFEIGPGGIRRTLPLGAGETAEPRPLARRDYLILAAFAAIAGVLIYRAAQDVRQAPRESAVLESGGPAKGEARLPNSVAVLPFTNISDDPANEYFCDGIAEEILDRLSRAGELTVIGRTSSFAFKDSDYGLERISALLGVRYLLQGSVRKAGNELRVAAQLLDEKGVQVWSESFDRRLENVFAIQSEIAAAVAQNVAARVLPERDTGHQPGIAAYDHYLRGRERLHARDWPAALAELRRAVELDPQFAESYAELGIAEGFEETVEAIDRGRAAVDRALELKPRLVRAHAARAFLLMVAEPPDLLGAERVLREVLAQDPNMSDALYWLQRVLAMQGRDDEARSILERAARIDPLHPSIAATYAGRLANEGRIEQALSVFERVLEQPSPGQMIFFAADDFYRSTGHLDRLIAAQKRRALYQPSFGALFFALQGFAVLGDWEMAEAINDRLLRVRPEGPGVIYRRIILPGLKGQTDLALRRVRESLAEKDLSLADLDPVGKVIAGTFFARGGDYAAAIEALEPVVDVESPYPPILPNVSYSPGPNMLAWAYLRTGAEEKAAPLLAAASRQCAERRAGSRHRNSIDLHHCAEVELLRGNRGAALDGLEEAIDAGWREYYIRERDPLWASVAADPRYRTLMVRVKADIDRQRAEVERGESDREFLAKLDAALKKSVPAT